FRSPLGGGGTDDVGGEPVRPVPDVTNVLVQFQAEAGFGCLTHVLYILRRGPRGRGGQVRVTNGNSAVGQAQSPPAVTLSRGRRRPSRSCCFLFQRPWARSSRTPCSGPGPRPRTAPNGRPDPTCPPGNGLL